MLAGSRMTNDEDLPSAYEVLIAPSARKHSAKRFHFPQHLRQWSSLLDRYQRNLLSWVHRSVLRSRDFGGHFGASTASVTELTGSEGSLRFLTFLTAETLTGRNERGSEAQKRHLCGG
jgi:hypothetical protein